MKAVRTVIVFDRGGIVSGKGWIEMHAAYLRAIRGVLHPPGKRRFTLRKKQLKTDAQGAATSQWRRNGVVPIKQQFFQHLEKSGWQTEQPVDSQPPLFGPETNEPSPGLEFNEFPGPGSFWLDREAWGGGFVAKLGEFDFYTELSGGLRGSLSGKPAIFLPVTAR